MTTIQLKDVFLDFGILFGNFWDQMGEPIIVLLGTTAIVLLLGALITFITVSIRKVVR